MRGVFCFIICGMVTSPVFAQDFYSQEIVVTGSRMSAEQDQSDEVDNERPAVGLRRKADFLVQQVTIRGDTRDQELRRQEIRTMLTQAVRVAGRYNVELAYGEYVLTPLTLENIEELTLQPDNRPDSEGVKFLVKASLKDNRTGAQAQEAIAAYIEAVPETGRAQMDAIGSSTMSIIGPDSYRLQITAEIASDARALTGQLGEGYAVQIEGLNKPVQWARSGISDVLLYIPYRLTVLPRP